MEEIINPQDIQRGTKFEKFVYINTLSGLLKSLENYYTIIDLRNESYISGKITAVDSYMNVEMKDAVLCDNRGVEHSFETFFVSARQIRYVHIPKGTSAKELLDKNLESLTYRVPTSKKKTFKEIRAAKYQKEVVQELGTPTEV